MSVSKQPGELGRRSGAPLPHELAMAFAGPVGGELLKLTNNPWVIRPALMGQKLAVERFTIVNDFGAGFPDRANVRFWVESGHPMGDELLLRG